MKRWIFASDIVGILMALSIVAFVFFEVTGGTMIQKGITLALWILNWKISNRLIKMGFRL